jgi:alpha-beta hydrolase superfamily lysophospholipase
MPSPNQADTLFDREVFWLSTPSGHIFTWLYTPKHLNPNATGFVLCPPLGHEYVHSYRSYRKLAEALATAGSPVIRFDYHGAGNSQADMLAPARLHCWKENILAQLNLLRDKTQVNSLGLFGVRMGANLALELCREISIDKLILWKPLRKGRQYVRELRAVSRFAELAQADSQNLIEAGGFIITQATLAELETLNVETAAELKVKNLLEIRAADDKSLISSLPSEITREALTTDSFENMMAEPQVSQTPEDVIAGIVRWNQATIQKTTIELPHLLCTPSHFNPIPNGLERVQIIQGRTFGILAEPDNCADNNNPVIIFCNSGSVHSVGPNRLYTEVARQLTQAGFISLRLDLRNLGDSPCGTVASDNHPYPQETEALEDIFAAINLIKQTYPTRKIALTGLCSGAYWTYRAALIAEPKQLDAAILINPLTFCWRDGLSLDIPQNQDKIREKDYYLRSAYSADKWLKLLKGKVDLINILGVIWRIIANKSLQAWSSILDRLNLRPAPPVAQEVSHILAKEIKLNFIFSSLDPGHELLLTEGGRRVRHMEKSGDFGVATIEGATHTFTQARHRQQVFNCLAVILKQLAQSSN